jgi:hypothetical protein
MLHTKRLDIKVYRTSSRVWAEPGILVVLVRSFMWRGFSSFSDLTRHLWRRESPRRSHPAALHRGRDRGLRFGLPLLTRLGTAVAPAMFNLKICAGVSKPGMG